VLRDDRLGEYFVPPELNSMLHPTSSSIPPYGRSQTASIQIAFDLTIQNISIDWRRSLFPQARETALGRFSPVRNADSSLDNRQTPAVAIHSIEAN
jgi:hypothetical protein